MASPDREGTESRFVMVVLVAVYLVTFWSSWLPIPRDVVGRLARLRGRAIVARPRCS
jgi:hypothetical protein